MKHKVWLSVFAILIIYGAYTLTHTNSGIQMETAEGLQTESNGFLSEVSSDFSNMVAIVKDFFTVYGGGESQYDNGLAVLTGSEEINDTEAGQCFDNGVSAIEEQISGAFSNVADALQVSGKEQILKDVILTEATVLSVVDGDTFYAAVGSSEIKIRLIGVDTPESVHTDSSRNTVWGTYASDYTKGILKEGMSVYLEYDEDPVDKYGRTLAYVWLSQDTSDIQNMLNAVLVNDGYAYDKVYMPNNKYASVFEQLRINAQNSGTGLWADEGFAALWEG